MTLKVAVVSSKSSYAGGGWLDDEDSPDCEMTGMGSEAIDRY